MRRAIWLPVLLTAIVSIPIRAQEGPDPKEVGRMVSRGDYGRGIKACDELIAYYTKHATESAMYAMLPGYYTLAKAQILALKPDHQSAATVLDDARQFAIAHPEVNGFLSNWQGVFDLTRGFLLEKKGDLAAAIQIYQASDSEHAHARLALLSLRQGKYAEARRWAVLEPTTPTSHFVLGQLEEQLHHGAAAQTEYEKAWSMLQDSLILGKNNEMLPIHFCEAKAIDSARLAPRKE